MAQKIYFRIGEVAKKFGVKPSLIRYWEKEFSFIHPKKSSGGTRLFTRKDVDNFEIVYHLIKEKGMTIQGVRDYFKKHYDKESLDKLQVINTLKRTRNLLLDVRQVLTENRK
ncbi:MerR family transcriptional regulator [Candidatus Sulfidibacterium hydrothermale]|uniref:MerR family transcriptional regulator n=1 Tax=Candidatus Sulfidibacterium hydrothermale TaxID=2875962 RepID=UPI001F0AE036|nr:MerR family transcriptional regulator [Candidatus Sulfidibacterium hydrothermale]UBM63461.1 MerR family transcriptional regulator [Candidatus Sulfidibacterium hydrothermale]